MQPSLQGQGFWAALGGAVPRAVPSLTPERPEAQAWLRTSVTLQEPLRTVLTPQPRAEQAADAELQELSFREAAEA